MPMAATRVGCDHYDEEPDPIRLTDAVLPFCVRCGRRHFLPNIDAWQPGDAVLFSSAAKRGVDAVRRLQMAAGLGDLSDWTHVGIYDGYGRIWDAIPKSHVRTRSMQDVFAPSAWVRIRRFPGVPIARRELLDVLTSLGEAQYDAWAYRSRYLARLQRADRRRAWDALWLPVPDDAYGGVVCSTFVALALRSVDRGHDLGRTPLPLPADFLEGSFMDVPLAFRHVTFA